MSQPRVIIFTAVLALVLASGGRPAQADNGSRALHEFQRASAVVSKTGLRVLDEEASAGRRIRTIHIVREDVFVDDEPWPVFLNAFHPLTKESTIRRELLFAPGDVWDPVRGAETVRNIRNIGIFSLVAVLPVLPAADEDDGTSIDIAIYTRDLWSLRLESSFSFNNTLLDRLSLSLVERNMFGRNMLLGAAFDLLPATFSIGDIFWERRLFNTRWSLSQSFDVIVNRETLQVEGTRGSVNIGLPLFELRPMWGFDADFAWNDSIGRQLQGANLLTWDNPETDAVETIPRIWDRGVYQGSIAVLRQFGRDEVHRIRVGYAAAVSTFTPHADTGLAGLDRRDPMRNAFENAVLAESRRELYPYIGWEIFDPTWVIFAELGAFGIAEEVRTGPWSSATFGAPLKTFGSLSNAITWRFAGGLVLAPRVAGDRALIDIMGSIAGRLDMGEVIDQRYQARIRLATPRFFGRIVLSADLDVRDRDSFRTLVTLGGDNGLRGHPSQAFFAFGVDRFRFNAEWRSPPIVLGSVHFGGVLFYDAGGLGEVARSMPMNHGVGAGIRVLFPQFNRFVFRLDLGAPLNGDSFSVLLSIGSSQLLPLTTLEDQKLAQ